MNISTGKHRLSNDNVAPGNYRDVSGHSSHAADHENVSGSGIGRQFDRIRGCDQRRSNVSSRRNQGDAVVGTATRLHIAGGDRARGHDDDGTVGGIHVAQGDRSQATQDNVARVGGRSIDIAACREFELPEGVGGGAGGGHATDLVACGKRYRIVPRGNVNNRVIGSIVDRATCVDDADRSPSIDRAHFDVGN